MASKYAPSRKVSLTPWYGFHEENNHLIENKKNGKSRKANIRHNYKKAQPISEFVAVTSSGGQVLLCSVSSLVTKVRLAGRQAGRRNFKVQHFFLKINIRTPVSVFLFLML